MSRLIYHVDVNSAFLSWEAVFRLRYLHENLDIRTIPSAIGGDRESHSGIILAKSIPAKKYGITTAEPIGDSLRKCPELMLFPPRFDYYRECSHNFMNILREASDLVEPFSIDEAFVDLTGNKDAVSDPVGFAERIRIRIFKELGFTVNIGISENKLLAKTASDFTKPDKVHTLWLREIPEKLWPLPVEDQLFVGASSARHLHDLGIHTIGDLAHTDEALLKSHFGKTAAGMIAAARGEDDSPVCIERSDNKGYSKRTTLSTYITERDEALLVLLKLCDNVGGRLRKDNAHIRTIGVSIRDSGFTTKSRQKMLDNSTNITNELYASAVELFDLLWDKTSPIRQLGVHASNVSDDSSHQYSLFDTHDYEKQEKMDRLTDALRSRFGDSSITRASLLNKQNEQD